MSIRVGIFGYGNLGDEMILRSAIRTLCDVGISDFSVLVRDTGVDLSGELDIKGVGIKLYDRMTDVAKAIDSSDVLVLCGGNLLQNETSLASLLYYSQIARFAKRRGKRLYILSGGFGELRGAYATYLASRCIRDADFCGCRTSYDLAIAKTYSRRSELMPDLCFTLKPSFVRKNKNSFAWVISKKGEIALTDILNISMERKLTPLAIVLNPEDKIMIEELKKHNVEVFSPERYDDFCTVIQGCAFTVSERLHGAIFSLTCHIPAYLSARSTKNAALISEVQRIVPRGFLLTAYSKSAVIAKKEIGAKDSDFGYLNDFMKREIYNALEKALD